MSSEVSRLFLKEPESKYFRFFGPYYLCCSHSDNTKANESGYVTTKLSTKTGGQPTGCSLLTLALDEGAHPPCPPVHLTVLLHACWHINEKASPRNHGDKGKTLGMQPRLRRSLGPDVFVEEGGHDTETSCERGVMSVLFMSFFGISGTHTLLVDKKSKIGHLCLFPGGFLMDKWKIR